MENLPGPRLADIGSLTRERHPHVKHLKQTVLTRDEELHRVCLPPIRRRSLTDRDDPQWRSVVTHQGAVASGITCSGASTVRDATGSRRARRNCTHASTERKLAVIPVANAAPRAPASTAAP